MENKSLVIDGVSKEYKNFKLDNVSFSVERGTVMGLVGQNGAGKTTLVRLIMNMITRKSGKITVCGLDNVEEELKVKNLLGYVADEDFMFSGSRLKNNAAVYAELFDNWDKSVYEKYVKFWDIPENKPVGSLSRGTRTKAMLALALPITRKSSYWTNRRRVLTPWRESRCLTFCASLCRTVKRACCSQPISRAT